MAVFQELAALGFTPAKRGEFTRRAIQNGRMDLLEAEAINDLVNSELEFERQVAIGNLMGQGAKYL
jgi:tRNA modification GTPase